MKRLTHLLPALLLLLLISQKSIGQDRIPVDLKPFNFTIGLIEPSLVTEFRLGQQQSFVATGGATLAFSNESAYVFPFLRGSFRHYYHRKRVKKSNLRPNSGNFISLQGGYYFGAFGDFITSLDKYFFFGPAWGFQRNYDSGIHLSLSLGFGYGNGENTNARLAGTGHFTFGFTLR